ncbi:predicted protein [Lichtheimia corymbifera JMRC:FSU:9682]|uniref:Uncharacterized protein n=1 Tax=Lichtheimia corymbifera JMRC:FSU:9682 TaxID=1263082 RepID=A0A068RX17_9FUNG|nr:predicted protein [Lichtheimia corymbifera JMRC:FSU:9682]
MAYANGCPPGMYPPPPPMGMPPYLAIPPNHPMSPAAAGGPPPSPYMMHPAYMAPAPAPHPGTLAHQSQYGPRPVMFNGGPRSPSISSPVSPSSRRSSRPLLDDISDDTPVIASRFRSTTPIRKD